MLFKMNYSEEFMKGASEVLQQVVNRYLKSGISAFPWCDITKEDIEVQAPWYRMMNSLADCAASVECLGPYGTFQPKSGMYMTTCCHRFQGIYSGAAIYMVLSWHQG